ncbi:maltose alpha-D-glucosyltransferase/ alpha-amylase [Pseudomonas sp. NFIX10]|uniref:alpha-amylase family protein n=1 Tax=unclassified Pseudomonas TaxID=196821 RepID=UPI0008E6D774|nr:MULTISPECIES: alpha-amylase family protein [unclassified Pseudomonas]SFB57491.1 maltose alpha-D-glucosyltransferase/ alpha-amylase [Pseudomonas sp. NFIX10]SFF51562.1 maltose alpha-D-glucosyltransferase/ alpha-amylase [Pseudomonas sp. NFACC06-1]
MKTKWHRNTLIYQIDPSLFFDSNGDGRGDLKGIIERLDYLQALGVGALWLMPLYRSPFKDAGYDVSDFMALDPRFGSEEDLRQLVVEARERGMRVILELVAQHTSDQHPWFLRARRDKDSVYRDYYVWSDTPVDDGNQPIFPSVEDSIWQWDEQAGQYYRHLFYRHEPDLNLANPRVIEEIERVMVHWLEFGIDGFRLDAASHLVEQAGGEDEEQGVWVLDRLYKCMTDINPEGVLLGEVDVEPERYSHYFGNGERLGLVLDFWVNNHVFLALARGQAEPLWRAITRRPLPPDGAQYAVWLRNHDELDLERLSAEEREEVMRAFAPDQDMRLYGRGIRRRLAPMLCGDVRHQALAQALLLLLPGTPIVRYGEEIGMGDDLSRPERLSVRTPMQWSAQANAGFSSARRLAAPVIDEGPFAYSHLNVEAQLNDPESLLERVRSLLLARAGLPEVGDGEARLLAVDQPAVFAISHMGKANVLMLANLGRETLTVTVEGLDLQGFEDIVSDSQYPTARGRHLTLKGYGYRWLRRNGSDH